MEDAQAKHCCPVTLVAVGEDLDPEVVTAALGLHAHQSWQRGERKSFVRPEGSVRYFDSIHERGGWKHFLPDRYKDESLSFQLFLWLARLRPKAEAIKALTARGWEIELDCFATGSEVLVLRNNELRELAELGIDLGITVAGTGK